MPGTPPSFKIIKGPFDFETKKWAEDLGALWPRKDNKPGYSGTITVDGKKHQVLVLPNTPKKSGTGDKKPWVPNPPKKTLGEIMDDDF